MKTTVWYLLVICLIKVKEMVNYIFARLLVRFRLRLRPRPTTKLQQMVLSAQIAVLSNGVERWTHLGLGDLYFDQKF